MAARYRRHCPDSRKCSFCTPYQKRQRGQMAARLRQEEQETGYLISSRRRPLLTVQWR